MRRLISPSMIASAWLCVNGLAAGAQQPVQAPSPAPLPPPLSVTSDSGGQLFERPNGMLLRPGVVVYDLSTIRAGQLAALGIRTVSVTESNLAGMPAWLIAESRSGTAVETSDSLYVSRGDLAPARWVATSGSAQLGASFTRDSMFGALQSYQGRGSFATSIGAGALVTPGMVERIVEMLPLQAGYRALASLVLIELGTPRSMPAFITVEREESLQLGPGMVDCWVVALRSGAMEEFLWVTRDAPRVVKTEQTISGGVLTSIIRP